MISVTTTPSDVSVIFSYWASASPSIERVMSAACGRFIVHVAHPSCTAVLVPPHSGSSAKSKRIAPGELLHWSADTPAAPLNCQSGVTPTPSQPQGEGGGEGGGGGATTGGGGGLVSYASIAINRSDLDMKMLFCASTVAGRSSGTRIMNSFIVSTVVDECVTCAPRWHISVMHPSRCSHMERRSGALWVWGGMGVSQGEASQREDGCREAGRMLRCVWVRLSTTQMRRAGDSWRRGAETEAWCRQRGA